MKRKELEKIRRSNLNKLDRSFRPKINAVEIDINNSIKHELGKVICFWFLRKGVLPEMIQSFFNVAEDYKFDNINEVFEELKLYASYYGQKFKRKWQVPQVVTEARFKELIPWGKGLHRRRADIFILDTGEIVEIETNKKIKKKGAIVVYV